MKKYLIMTKYAKGLSEKDHKALALWAADCAEHVLHYFDKSRPQDKRPRQAIEAARAWVHGDLRMIEARKAAFASHAAARDTIDLAAQAAARAAGHAAATAHVADHARHAASYALKAVSAANDKDNAMVAERNWQYECLPRHLRQVAFPIAKHESPKW